MNDDNTPRFGTESAGHPMPPSTSSSQLGRWMPAAAAFVLVMVVVGSGFVFASGDSSGPGDREGFGTVPVSGVVATIGSTSSTPPTSAVVAETVKVPLDRTIERGDVGDDVRRLQERLAELPFDPGPIDGTFGQVTQQAVWAYEKLVLGVARDDMTGHVTPEMWDRMQDPLAVEPRRRTGVGTTHTEIYLVEQIVAVFEDDQPILITHASSGDGEEWCDRVTYDTDPSGNALDEPVERDICGISKTPGGVFSFTRKVEGIRESPLGSLWNPVYFNYGIAIHGAINVPSYPTSHGCVRIPMHISDYFQSLVSVGDRVFVWNGEKEPEQLTKREMLPVFDYPNPDATTTTTSTTTTTTTTTVAPTSTVAPMTTVAPATTVAPTPATTAAATTSTVPIAPLEPATLAP